MKKDEKLLSTRWDLSPLYKSINDKQILNDIKEVETISFAFPKNYKGKLDTKLHEALVDIIKIDEITTTMFAYFYLMGSRDAENQEIKKQTSIATERISLALANLTFFDIELGAISKESYESQLKTSPLLKKHKPYMDKIRKNAKYQLSESVETILTKVSPFMIKIFFL